MSNTSKRRYQTFRLFKERTMKLAVAIGGMGVIAAIALIFFYLLYEVAPLLKGAQLNEQTQYAEPLNQGQSPIFLSMDEQAEVALRIYPSGVVAFTAVKNGGTMAEPIQLPLPKGASITNIQRDGRENGVLAAGLSTGQVLVFKQRFTRSWSDGKSTVAPGIDYPYGDNPFLVFLHAQAIESLAISSSDNQLLIAGSTGQKTRLIRLLANKKERVGHTTWHQSAISLPAVSAPIKHLLLSPDQQWLYINSQRNRLTLINIADLDNPKRHCEVSLTVGNESVTQVVLLLGGISLLVGDDTGTISQWFLVRNDGKKVFTRIRQFELGTSPIEEIVPEHRRKGFLALDKQGLLGVFYTTSADSLLTHKIANNAVHLLSIAPRADVIMADDNANTHVYQLNNEYPEVSWSALWHKVWYESYSEPDYVWQSSAASNDYEPKLSLTPLAFGTLKAAFYAMLLAIPLAICAAIYTACFMTAGLRRKIKPAIELMEALPTVILGFLAGLWLAPVIESQLAGVFALVLFVPLSILLFAVMCDHWVGKVGVTLPKGGQALLLVPVILGAGALAIKMAGPLEDCLFNGDMLFWLTREAGIPYDQRNALVVGIAMGFAVIPTIYSIAEDAIFSVPKHLSDGSLALGATPWQTTTRVVLLTASPGIFSAVMIGLGRAVGETMIVLMATGNTPIMDANIFEGMRTLAANIAVEMPEAEVGSGHYRVLFLAALVLFMFTFIVNTIAEIVRQRLRKRYSLL